MDANNFTNLMRDMLNTAITLAAEHAAATPDDADGARRAVAEALVISGISIREATERGSGVAMARRVAASFLIDRVQQR